MGKSLTEKALKAKLTKLLKSNGYTKAESYGSRVRGLPSWSNGFRYIDFKQQTYLIYYIDDMTPKGKEKQQRMTKWIMESVLDSELAVYVEVAEYDDMPALKLKLNIENGGNNSESN